MDQVFAFEKTVNKFSFDFFAKLIEVQKIMDEINKNSPASSSSATPSQSVAGGIIKKGEKHITSAILLFLAGLLAGAVIVFVWSFYLENPKIRLETSNELERKFEQFEKDREKRLSATLFSLESGEDRDLIEVVVGNFVTEGGEVEDIVRYISYDEKTRFYSYDSSGEKMAVEFLDLKINSAITIISDQAIELGSGQTIYASEIIEI